MAHTHSATNRGPQGTRRRNASHQRGGSLPGGEGAGRLGRLQEGDTAAETGPAHPRQEKGRPGEWRSPREEGGKKGPGQTSQQHQQLKDSVQKGSENTRQSVSLEGNAICSRFKRSFYLCYGDGRSDLRDKNTVRKFLQKFIQAREDRVSTSSSCSRGGDK